MRLNFFIVILISFNFGCTSIVDDLTTEPIQPEETGKTIGAGIDDPKMKTFIGVNIKKADPDLDKAHVNVSVFNGLVLLTGEVPNNALRSIAGDIACETIEASEKSIMSFKLEETLQLSHALMIRSLVRKLKRN